MQLRLVPRLELAPRQQLLLKKLDDICLIHTLCDGCHADTCVLDLDDINDLTELDSLPKFADEYEKMILRLLKEFKDDNWKCPSSDCDGTLRPVAIIHNQETHKEKHVELLSISELVIQLLPLLAHGKPIRRDALITHDPHVFVSLIVQLGTSKTWRKKLKAYWTKQQAEMATKHTVKPAHKKKVAHVLNIEDAQEKLLCVDRLAACESSEEWRHHANDSTLIELRLQLHATITQLDNLKEKTAFLKKRKDDIELLLLERMIDELLSRANSCGNREEVRERLLARLQKT